MPERVVTFDTDTGLLPEIVMATLNGAFIASETRPDPFPIGLTWLNTGTTDPDYVKGDIVRRTA